MKQPVLISDIVADNQSADHFGDFTKMIRRKQRCYQTEQQSFSDMQQNEQLARWLDDFTLHDAENDEDIHFTALQKHDLNLLLQKQYSLIQWEQGSGKTLAGIATGTYRMQRQNAL